MPADRSWWSCSSVSPAKSRQLPAVLSGCYDCLNIEQGAECAIHCSNGSMPSVGDQTLSLSIAKLETHARSVRISRFRARTRSAIRLPYCSLSILSSPKIDSNLAEDGFGRDLTYGVLYCGRISDSTSADENSHLSGAQMEHATAFRIYSRLVDQSGCLVLPGKGQCAQSAPVGL